MIEDALGKKSELVQSERRFLFRVSYDFSNDLLIGTTAGHPASFPFVDYIQTVGLGGGFLIHPRIFIGADLPLHYVKLSNSFVSGGFDPSAWKFGDADFYAKIRLTNDESSINVALRPQLTLPTGNNPYFISDDSYGMGGQLLMDTSIQKWKFFANVGMSYASNSQFLNIDRKTRLNYGLGAFYKITRHWGLNGEWIQSFFVTDFNNGQTPTQINLGLRYRTPYAVVFLGGGIHTLKFSGNSDPLSIYTGIKIPLGVKKSDSPAIPSTPQTVVPTPTTTIETPADVPNVSDELEYISTMIIYFDNNHRTVKNEYKNTLDKVAALILAHKNQIRYVVVIGYSDPPGDETYNKVLSEKRAKSVKKYLIERGVDEHSILTDGYGESDPKTSDQKQYSTHRRVEFRIINRPNQ